jgi:hypothetical protein
MLSQPAKYNIRIKIKPNFVLLTNPDNTLLLKSTAGIFPLEIFSLPYPEKSTFIRQDKQ